MKSPKPNNSATCVKIRTFAGMIYFALSDGTFWKIGTREFGKRDGKWEQLGERPPELEK